MGHALQPWRSWIRSGPTAYMSRNHGYMIYDTACFGTDEKKNNIKPQMVESWNRKAPTTACGPSS